MKTNGQHEVTARIAKTDLVLAAVFALMFAGSSVGRAQSRATPPAVPAATPAKTAPAAPAQIANSAEKPAGGMHQGINVHGHWVIEVKNPDGTVTARREFENSVQTSGMAYLASLLAGNNTPGGLSVLLNGATASLGIGASNTPGNNSYIYFSPTQAGPCLPMTFNNGSGVNLGSGGSAAGTTCLLTPESSNGDVGVLSAECLLFQETYSNTQTTPPTGQTSPCSTNLAVSAPTWEGNSTTSGSSLQIVGSVSATSTVAGNVTDVETVFTTCDSSISSASCLLSFNAQTLLSATNQTIFPAALSFLTERTLNGPTGSSTAPVAYSPGQVINVQVTISFQ